jgi:hypothetical protein
MKAKAVDILAKLANNDEGLDLSAYDLIEIETGRPFETIRVKVADGKLIIAADRPLVIYPRASNMIEIDL